MRAIRAFALLGIAGLIAPVRALASGVPVLPFATVGLNKPTLVADGSGGAFLGFKTDSLNIGVARLTATGELDPTWRPTTNATGGQFQVSLSAATRMVANDDHEVLLCGDQVWSFNPSLTAVDATGMVPAGFPVPGNATLSAPVLLPGDGGGSIIVGPAAQFGATGVSAEFHAADGRFLGETDAWSSYQVDQLPTDATTDGAGGAVIAATVLFSTGFTTGFDLGLFRIAADGSLPWGSDPVPIVALQGPQTNPSVWPDGQGGTLVAWMDGRNLSTSIDIYTQRITSAGGVATGWAPWGVLTCGAIGGQSQPRVVDDAAGGAWIAWLDSRNGTSTDLYDSHVLANGRLAPGFANAGRLLATAPGIKNDLHVVPDGLGGIFVAWVDGRAETRGDIYASHVGADGAVSLGWPANGLGVCTDPAVQDQVALTMTVPGRALVAWRDQRGGPGHSQIDALGLTTQGVLQLAVGVEAAGTPALRLSSRGPASGPIRLEFTTPSHRPAAIELFDVQGRVVDAVRLESPGPEIEIRLGSAETPPGLYFASARQDGARATARVSVVR